MGCLLPGLEPYPTLSSQEKRLSMAGWDSARASDMLTVFQVYVTWLLYCFNGYGLKPADVSVGCNFSSNAFLAFGLTGPLKRFTTQCLYDSFAVLLKVLPSLPGSSMYPHEIARGIEFSSFRVYFFLDGSFWARNRASDVNPSSEISIDRHSFY